MDTLPSAIHYEYLFYILTGLHFDTGNIAREGIWALAAASDDSQKWHIIDYFELDHFHTMDNTS